MAGISDGSLTWHRTDLLEFSVRDFFRAILDREMPHAFAVGCEVTLEVAEDVPQVVRAVAGVQELVVTWLVADVLEKVGSGRANLRVFFESKPLPAVGVVLSFEPGGGSVGTDGDKRPGAWFESTLMAATRLAQSLGGDIRREAESSDKGTVSLRFPVEVVVERSMLQGLLEGPLEAHGVKALVAHQDPGRRVALRMALEDAGFVVTEADNGYQALGLLQQASAQGGEFDVVLASEALPGLGGAALAAAVRADPDTGRPPVLVLRPAGAKGRAETHNGSRTRFIPETMKASRLLLAVQYAMSRARRAGTSKLRRRSVITRSIALQEGGRLVPESSRREAEQSHVTAREDTDAKTARSTVKMAAPVDLSMLDEMTDGDEDLIRELAGLFLEELREQRAGLEESLKKEDVEAARRHAHTIKGAAANFGAERLRSLAAELEALAKKGDLDSIHARLADLDESIDETVTWLRRLLD